MASRRAQIELNLGQVGTKLALLGDKAEFSKNLNFPHGKTMILKGPERPTNDVNWTLEANLGQLERSSNNLGQHWPQVGPTWSQLGANLSQVGANLEPTWNQYRPTSTNWATTWASMGHFEPSWRQLGPPLQNFGQLRPNLGPI